MKIILSYFFNFFFIILLPCYNFASNSYQSAFGELLSVQPQAIVQLQYPYGNLNPNYVNATGSFSGTVSNTGNFAQLAIPSGGSGAALLRSKDRLHYQPGQGCESLFTAIFTSGISGTSQQIGLGNMATGESGVTADTTIQDGFFFGYYNGTSVSYTGVTGSASPTGSPTGTGILHGDTFGIIHTCNSRTYFYPQTSWNQDTMNGAGPSGLTLDVTKGNVYKIQYQWLGFGLIGFYIENPTTGQITLVHTIEYANQNTITTLLNPSMQLLAKITRAATGSGDLTLKNPSFAGIIEGKPNTNQDVRFAASSAPITTTGSVGYTLATSSNTTFYHILSIQNKSLYNGLPNQVEIVPDWISVINVGANNSECMLTLRLNPTFSSALTYQDVGTYAVVQYAPTPGSNTPAINAGITVTNGSVLATFYTVQNQNVLFSLKDFTFKLAPNDILTLTATTINGAQIPTIIASIGWHGVW